MQRSDLRWMICYQQCQALQLNEQHKCLTNHCISTIRKCKRKCIHIWALTVSLPVSLVVFRSNGVTGAPTLPIKIKLCGVPVNIPAIASNPNNNKRRPRSLILIGGVRLGLTLSPKQSAICNLQSPTRV